ncbi:hypothetical protein ACWCQQ_33765 [Streptomyces sp. NPDC002143]
MFRDELPLPVGYPAQLRELREVMDTLDRQLELLDREISTRLTDDVGYRAIQKIGGFGPVLAAEFVT